MGIYTNRGFEYIVIVDKTDKTCIDYLVSEYKGYYYQHLDAVTIIQQMSTDDRLIHTNYFKNLQSSWFLCGHPFMKALSLEDIKDFEIFDNEKELIRKINEDQSLKGFTRGWYDVSHVSDTYDI